MQAKHARKLGKRKLHKARQSAIEYCTWRRAQERLTPEGFQQLQRIIRYLYATVGE